MGGFHGLRPDGFELGYISFEEARSILQPMAMSAKIASDLDERGTIGKLRAVAIGELVNVASSAFLKHEADFLSGTFSGELIAKTGFGDDIKAAKDMAKKKIYWSDRKTKLEIAGSVIITGLLDFYHTVILDLERSNWNQVDLKGQSQKLARLIPNGFSGVKSRYGAWLRITDFISGMTDRFALDLYRKLKGIAI